MLMYSHIFAESVIDIKYDFDYAEKCEKQLLIETTDGKN